MRGNKSRPAAKRSPCQPPSRLSVPCDHPQNRNRFGNIKLYQALAAGPSRPVTPRRPQGARWPWVDSLSLAQWVSLDSLSASERNPRLSRFGLYWGGSGRKTYSPRDRVACEPLVPRHTGELQSEPTCATLPVASLISYKARSEFFGRMNRMPEPHPVNPVKFFEFISQCATFREVTPQSNLTRPGFGGASTDTDLSSIC